MKIINHGLALSVLIVCSQYISAFALDSNLVGHWRSTAHKPDGTWTVDWVVSSSGNYHSDISGPFAVPPEDGMLTGENGTWSVKAVSGRTDSGNYKLVGNTLKLQGKNDGTNWTRIADRHVQAIPAVPRVARANVGINQTELVYTGPVSAESRRLYDQAMIAKRNGADEKAAELLSLAIKNSPGFVDARYQRGVCLNRMVDAGQSAGLTLQSLIPTTIFGKAAIVWKAISDFNAVIALQPNNAKAYCMRGICRMESLQFEDAVRDFDRAINLDPSYAFAYGYRAIAYIDTFAPEGTDMQKCLSLDPALKGYFAMQEKNAREFRHEYKALQVEMARRMEAACQTAASEPLWSASSSEPVMSTAEQHARERGDDNAASRIRNGVEVNADKEYHY